MFLDGANIKLRLYRDIWHATWRGDKGTERRSLHTKDRAEAVRQFQLFKEHSAEAIKDIAGVHDILISYAEEKRTRVSYDRIKDAIKQIDPFFGWMRPSMLHNHQGRLRSREYAKQRGVKAQPGTIRRELAVLRAALNWALKDAPIVIELPPAPPPRERYLTHEEVDKLLNAALEMAPHIWLFIMMAYYTAARKSAILGLTWMQVDFTRKLIQLNDGVTHGNKRRAVVPLHEALLEPLRRAQEVAVSPYVIEFNGQRIASVRHGFASAVKRAGLDDVGLDDVTPHVLRHTAAVHMVEQGVPISAIAQYLGHTNPAITYSTYARYSPDYLREAAAALPTFDKSKRRPNLRVVPLSSKEQ